MVSATRKLARYFKRNFGIRFNPLFVEHIRCGSIVDIDGPTDIDYISQLSDFGEPLPNILRSEAHFPEVRSLKELSFTTGKRFDLSEAIPVEGEVKAMIERASSLSLSFGQVEMTYVNQVPIDIMIRRILEGEHRRHLKSYLRDHHNHVVTAVYRAPIEIHLRADAAGDLSLLGRFRKSLSSSSGLTWVRETEMSLRSERPVCFGFETARWRSVSKRLRATS